MRFEWRAALTAAAMLTVLGGCATAPGYDTAMAVKPAGDKFHKTLAINYQKLAKEEYGKQDWDDAVHYAQKAEKASKGGDVQPDTVASRDLPPAVAAEASKGYAQMMDVLKRGAAKHDGELAADMISSFDCWIEQAEATATPERIGQCRIRFLSSVAAMQSDLDEAAAEAAAKKAKPAPAAKPAAHGPWTVIFDLGKAEITYDGQLAINNAYAAASDQKKAKVVVSGYSDLSGKPKANLKLSERRVHAVVDTLEMLGIAKSRITAKAYGATDPVVQVKGPNEKNRRVVIILTD